MLISIMGCSAMWSGPYFIGRENGHHKNPGPEGPPIDLDLILRMYLLQVWFNLSDPGTEDDIYDSYAMRRFTGIDFLKDSVPDETTLCNFRHLLEEHGLNKLFFDAINRVEEVAQDEYLSSVDYSINLRPGRFPKVSDNAIDWTRQIEKRKSSVRSKVEHIFRIIKCQFGYRKVRYRGLKKDVNQCYCEGIDYTSVDPLIFRPCHLKLGLFSEVPKYSNGTYVMQMNGQVYTMGTVGFGSEGIKFPVFEGEFKKTATRGKQIALIETPNLAQKLNNYEITALGEWEGLVAALYGIYVDYVTFSINNSHYRKTYLDTFNKQNSLYDPAFKGQIVD